MPQKHKKIGWESWNAKVEHMLLQADDTSSLEEFMKSHLDPSEPADDLKFIDAHPRIVHTPYGPYFLESMLKPSDRWNCWLAYTNFSLTKSIVSEVELINGVEALKPLGRYTFFLGIGKLYDPTMVRLKIEEELCDHKEIEEEINENLGEIITNIKSQVTQSSYWSIFITPEGDVDYIMSDDMNDEYMQSLHDFERRKSKLGGIILRSTNE